MNKPTTIHTNHDTTHRGHVDAVATLHGPSRTVVVLSLKSAQGTAQARTYREALETILDRCQALPGVAIVDAFCSAKTVADLPIEQRRCLPELAADDFADLQPVERRAALVDAQRRSIQRACAKVGRPAGAKGSGNPTRALTLRVELPGYWNPDHAVAFLCQPHETTTFGRASTARDSACSIERRTEPNGQIAMFPGCEGVA